MIKQVLSQFPFAYMPTMVMMLFLLFFVSMIIWVYRRGSTEFYKKIEQIPLEEESQQ